MLQINKDLIKGLIKGLIIVVITGVFLSVFAITIIDADNNLKKQINEMFEKDKETCSLIGENWRYSPSEGQCRNIKTNETQPLTY